MAPLRTALLLPLAVVVLGCPADPPPGPLLDGDGLVWLTQVDTPSFWESTDVEVRGGVAYVCTGVRSMTVHDIDPLENAEYERRLLFPGSHDSFPRCSHLASDGDRLVVSSHRDEVQTTPWVALVDISDRDRPELLDSLETDLSLEEPVLSGDDLWVAAHDDGLLHFSVAGDSIEQAGGRADLGNVSRVTTFGDGVAIGTFDGSVIVLDDDLQTLAQVDLGSPVQALLEIADQRIAVALGSEGLAILDADGGILSRLDTHGIALRLDHIAQGQILVANWSDLRVYDVTGEAPVLRAVDAVFEAGSRPRHLAAGASGDLVVTGEWEGVHVLRHLPDVDSPELTPSTLLVKVAADGEEQETTLTVTNEGRLALEVTDIDAPSGWHADPTSLALEPGESADVSLLYEGSTTTANGTLELHSNDPDERPSEVELQVGSNRVFVGDEAPDFSYLGLNTGETHTLSDQFGKVVLLSYFGVF